MIECHYVFEIWSGIPMKLRKSAILFHPYTKDPFFQPFLRQTRRWTRGRILLEGTFRPIMRHRLLKSRLRYPITKKGYNANLGLQLQEKAQVYPLPLSRWRRLCWDHDRLVKNQKSANMENEEVSRVKPWKRVFLPLIIAATNLAAYRSRVCWPVSDINVQCKQKGCS